MFKTALKTDWFLISVLIVIAVFIRSLNFTDFLNFSSDQAIFSIEALKILRDENNDLVLKGPPISLKLESKEIYQGGIIYYFQALFLYLGDLNPITASYLFTLFSSLVIVPLYVGLKFLTNKNKALFIAVIYALLPVFINYTKFLWNPNFQLSLIPFLILFLGLHKKTNKVAWLFVSGVWLGLILQFHYQLIIGIILIVGYLKLYLKISIGKICLLITGIMIGFLPIIVVEFKNNFSNFNTLIFYLRNLGEFLKSNSGSGLFNNQHYFLSLILIIIVIFVSYLKSIKTGLIIIVFIGLLTLDLFLYFPKPTQGFGMDKDWKYSDEERVFNLIKNENISGYNVTNLSYDSLALVQKYLHKKDKIDLTNYWVAERMFVIAPKTKDIFDDSAYEIQVIKPFKIIKTWQMNQKYNLYFLEKN